MKLGQALTLRARNGHKLNDLRNRISASALVQEGDSPPEDVVALRRDHDDLSSVQAKLVYDINVTNVTEGLLKAILEREHIKRKIAAHGAALQATTSRSFRYGREEIKWVSQIDIAQTHVLIDELQKELESIDFDLQSKNWTVDLIES